MKKVSLSTLLAVDVIALAIVWLMPPVPAGIPVRRIFLVILAAAALFLIFMLGRSRTTQPHAKVAGIEPVSRINPAQYLTRNGMVCPGGDGRCRVTFLLEDDSKVELSLSARQAGALAVGMRGHSSFGTPCFCPSGRTDLRRPYTGVPA